MAADRYVPHVGDDVVVTMRGVVVAYEGGNRVLWVRYGPGRPRAFYYDARSLIDEGLTVEPAGHLAAVTA